MPGETTPFLVERMTWRAGVRKELAAHERSLLRMISSEKSATSSDHALE
jgi:hypothetical protein